MELLYVDVDEHLHRHSTLASSARCDVLSELDALFDASWIYHDLSIEGAIFRDNELERGLQGREGANWSENQLLARVRNFKRAIDFVRHSARLQAPFDLNFIKDIHRNLCDDGDETAGIYRKGQIPSSAYRHDLVAPSAISYRLRRLVAKLEEASGDGHAITTACEIHRTIIEVFPFSTDNGIVARLAMNAWLMREGYAPAIIHAHDRQAYFDSYLSDTGTFRKLVGEAIIQGLSARIRGLRSN